MSGLLPDSDTIAERLADKYGYPLSDRHNLVRVAQFMALTDPALLRDDYLRLLQRGLFSYLGLKPSKEERQRFRNTGFTETAEALDWAAKVLDVEEKRNSPPAGKLGTASVHYHQRRQLYG